MNGRKETIAFLKRTLAQMVIVPVNLDKFVYNFLTHSIRINTMYIQCVIPIIWWIKRGSGVDFFFYFIMLF